MEIRDLPIDELVLDPTLNLRDRLDQDTVDRYIESWQRMPPVTVFEVEGRWLLADGVHRHAAAASLGKRTLKAEVRPGSFDDALDYVTVANLNHGLPLTRAERRRAVEVRLRLHHDRSDRHLAEEMGVGRELIARVRRQLVEGGQIPEGGTRLGADGKTYPALSKDPNERLPRTAEDAGAEPESRGRRGKPEAPWDDTVDPLPPISQGNPIGAVFPTAVPPWQDAPDARALAVAPPAPSAAPTIEEMIALMTRQVMDVVQWSQAEGFVEAYRTASGNARGLFQSAAIKLAARADALRKA